MTCTHAAAQPWIEIDFDVKSDRDTTFGEIWRCPDCHLGFVDPMPKPEDIPAHYDLPSYYTQGVSHFAKVAPRLSDRILRYLAWSCDHPDTVLYGNFSALGLQPRTLLDIGCGHGGLLLDWQARGVNAYGIEPDPLARAGATERGGWVYDGSAENIPADISTRRYDAIVMSHVLEHCRDPARALRNVCKLLSEVGTFYCEVPNCGCHYFRTYGQISEMLDVPRHLHFFDKTALERLAGEAGLEILDWRWSGYTRHFDPSWYGWENSIHDRIRARGHAPAVPRRTQLGSLWLLVRTALAAPENKFDSIGFFARRIS